jgi:hypothetical protein
MYFYPFYNLVEYDQFIAMVDQFISIAPVHSYMIFVAALEKLESKFLLYAIFTSAATNIL